MVELVEPLGHTDLVCGLVRSSRDERLPHALLFEGDEGIGKFVAARWLAAALLCESGGDAPCRQCGSCKRFQSDNHADVLVVDHRAAEQNAITIHFVVRRDPRPADAYSGTAIEEFLSLRAAEGRGKFIIVREADAMNEEAQNAFLKMLEEPRPGVHLLLESSSPGSLLATVRSRVVPLRFGALDAETCDEILWRDGPFKFGVDDDLVARLTRLGAGSPGKALKLHARGVPAMEDLLGAAFTGRRSNADVAAELFQVDGEFPGKTPAAERRTLARTVLDLGLAILTDIERAAAGLDPGALPHGDLATAAMGGPLEDQFVRRRIGRAWLAAREDLGLNLLPEALIERALSAR